MNDDQLTSLKKELQEFIKKTVDEQFKVLRKEIHQVQDTVNLTNKDMADDRHDIGDLKVAMGAIKLQFEEILEQFGKQTRKIVEGVEHQVSVGVDRFADTVVETVEPAVQSTLNDFVSTDPKIMRKQKNWFQKLKATLNIFKRK